MWSWLLMGIGGVALVVALILQRANRPEGPSQGKHKTPTTGETALASDISDAMTIANGQSEPTGIEWEESEDVYAPLPVEAATFIQGFELPRLPDILPKQSYLFVKRGVLATMDAHLKGDVRVEQGGLLLGQAFVDTTLATYLLVIHEALPAPDGIETPTFFGYTNASWRALVPQLQQMDASWTIMGSYHSHPDMGVFLSETDLGTQEDIFCADWQIAAVVDPVRNEIGFFVGKEGTPCGDWYPV